MTRGRKIFIRLGAVVGLFAWLYAVSLAVFNVKPPTGRRIDLLPALQALFGESAGFVIDGCLWAIIGSGLIAVVFIRTSKRREPVEN
jgi:hypothetical protein